MDIRALIDELDKLGEVSDDQATAALERLDTLERQRATAGQVARYGALGAAAGAGVGAIRNVISKSPNSWRGALGNAVGGAITAGAVPVLQKHWDRKAEENTLEKYIRENTHEDKGKGKTAAVRFGVPRPRPILTAPPQRVRAAPVSTLAGPTSRPPVPTPRPAATLEMPPKPVTPRPTTTLEMPPAPKLVPPVKPTSATAAPSAALGQVARPAKAGLTPKTPGSSVTPPTPAYEAQPDPFKAQPAQQQQQQPPPAQQQSQPAQQQSGGLDVNSIMNGVTMVAALRPAPKEPLPQTSPITDTIKYAFSTNEASGPMNPGYNSTASRQQPGFMPRADRGGSPVPGHGFSPTRGGFLLASGAQGPVGFYKKQAEAKKLKEKDSETLETYIPYGPGDFKRAKLAGIASRLLGAAASRPELALAAAGTVAGAAAADEDHRGEGALGGASTGLTLGSLGSAFMGKKLAFKLQGHTNHQGLGIAIENRKGSVRKGVDKDGKPWRTEMKLPYGYIKGSNGADGEEVDCYVGPVKDAPEAHVVHQHRSNGKGYDEDKVMLGFNSKEEAREAYLKHYNDPKFLGPMKSVPIERLKELVESGKKLVKISALQGARKFSKPGALGAAGRSIEQIAKPIGFGRAGAVAGTLKSGNI